MTLTCGAVHALIYKATDLAVNSGVLHGVNLV